MARSVKSRIRSSLPLRAEFPGRGHNAVQMNRVGSLRWRLWSLWFATLAGFGLRRPSVMWLRSYPPEPFWRRWWHMLKPPPAPPADLVPPAPPPWAGPPESEIGVAVPVRTVLMSQPRLVIALTDCVAYSNGFTLGIAVRSRDEVDHRSMGFGPPMEIETEGTLQVGIRFTDGRRATTSVHGPSPELMADYKAWREGREPELPAGPVISHGSGGGSGTRWDFQYWVWPLPPEGPLTVSCEWRAGGAALSTKEVDGGAIQRAGSFSRSLWDDSA